MNPNDQICQRPGCRKKRSEHESVTWEKGAVLYCTGKTSTFLPPTEPEGKPPFSTFLAKKHGVEEVVELNKVILTLRTQLAEMTKERDEAIERAAAMDRLHTARMQECAEQTQELSACQSKLEAITLEREALKEYKERLDWAVGHPTLFATLVFKNLNQIGAVKSTVQQDIDAARNKETHHE